MISIRCVKSICDRYTEIENYEVAVNSPVKYVCHHRREVQNGVQIWTKDELIKVGQYFKVEPEDLIFMPMSEHISLHKNAYDPKRKCLCKVMTDEQKEKISKARMGMKPWNAGTTGRQKWSENQREKFNEYTKSDVFNTKYTAERNKKISDARKKLKRVYNSDGTYRMIKEAK